MKWVAISLILFLCDRSSAKQNQQSRTMDAWCLNFKLFTAPTHIPKLLSFVKVNIDGSALKKYTNWDKLNFQLLCELKKMAGKCIIMELGCTEKKFVLIVRPNIVVKPYNFFGWSAQIGQKKGSQKTFGIQWVTHLRVFHYCGSHYHNFWLKYAQVRVIRGSSTVPLTRISRNAVSLKSQNPSKVGPYVCWKKHLLGCP